MVQTNTHTHDSPTCNDQIAQQQQSFYGPLSGTTRVSRYQKKYLLTHHRDHHPVFISFFHLLRSIASSLFKLHAWQSFCTTSVHVLFGLPLCLEPLYLIFHTFLHPVSVSLQHMSIPSQPVLLKIISSIPSLSTPYLELLSFTLTLHIHLTILISPR